MTQCDLFRVGISYRDIIIPSSVYTSYKGKILPFLLFYYFLFYVYIFLVLLISF